MNYSQIIAKSDSRCSCANCLKCERCFDFGTSPILYICKAAIDICQDEGIAASKVYLSHLEGICDHYDHDEDEFFTQYGESAGEYDDEATYNCVEKFIDFPGTLF